MEQEVVVVEVLVEEVLVVKSPVARIVLLMTAQTLK
jgi:hypothetical protein